MAAPEQKMRVVFMGTPDFAATVLRHVAAWPGCEVVAAYCQPDRPAGRGHKLQPPAVKVLAQELGIPVFQPLNFKDEADRAALAGLRPDALVVAAYGLILPQSVLEIPTIGPFNVHGSLLPQYRGAAPIQRAIMDGNHLTGITIMRMERGLDTGPMLLQRALGIGIDDTAAEVRALRAQGIRVAAVFMGENAGVPAANAIYGRDLARIRRIDQLAATAGRLIQDEIRELSS